jgi:hypothetical protein
MMKYHNCSIKYLFIIYYYYKHNVWVYSLDGRKLTSYSGYSEGLGIKTIAWNTNIQMLAVANYDQTVTMISFSKSHLC